MIRFGLVLLSLILFSSSFGQTKEYFDRDILKAQRKTVAVVIYGLKTNNIDVVLPYFEDGIENLESKLQQSVMEIDKFKKSTTLSDVVSYDEESHIFTCRYSDNERARFQIDLYLNPNDPNSKIIKVVIIKDKVLKKEYERRMNSVKIPPPPIKKKTKNH